MVWLTTSGADGIFGTLDDPIEQYTFTDLSGHYIFDCVAPGEYRIVFYTVELMDAFSFTPSDQGNDDLLDSDADTLTGSTPPFLVLPGSGDNFSFDAGLTPGCLKLHGGGLIGYSQVICAGFYPDPLVSLYEPGNGMAAIEYMWMYITGPGPVSSDNWIPIPDSNSPDYAPGQLYQSTTFIRCARYAGCDEFQTESNMITIKVIPYDPVDCPQPDETTATRMAERPSSPLYLYPNPSDGEVYLKTGISFPEPIQIRLFDSLGREVYFEKVDIRNSEPSPYLIDLSHLPSGLYLYQINGNSGLIIRE
jgi:hypothetical protein